MARRATSKAKALDTSAVVRGDGSVEVYPNQGADTLGIVTALLKAGDPADVLTVTCPNGWVVPEKVARDAGAM